VENYFKQDLLNWKPVYSWGDQIKDDEVSGYVVGLERQVKT